MSNKLEWNLSVSLVGSFTLCQPVWQRTGFQVRLANDHAREPKNPEK